MSKDLNNNERYLKELADGHKPVPPPMVWENIEEVLEQKKGRRRLFPIIWGSGILLLGLIVFINFKGKKDKEYPIIEQDTKISNYQSDPNSDDIKTMDSKTIKKENKDQNVNLLESQATNSIKQKEQKIDSEKPKTLVTQLHPVKHLKTYLGQESSSSNTIVNHGSEITASKDIYGRIKSTESFSEAINSKLVPNLPRLNWLAKRLAISKPIKDISENLILSPILKAQSNPSLTSPWFIDLAGGIGRNLSDPIVINPAQGALRMDTESKWYSWSTSIQVGYQFDNLWYSTIGIDLNQTKNRFDFWRRDVSGLVVGEDQSFKLPEVTSLALGRRDTHLWILD